MISMSVYRYSFVINITFIVSLKRMKIIFFYKYYMKTVIILLFIS